MLAGFSVACPLSLVWRIQLEYQNFDGVSFLGLSVRMIPNCDDTMGHDHVIRIVQCNAKFLAKICFMNF